VKSGRTSKVTNQPSDRKRFSDKKEIKDQINVGEYLGNEDSIPAGTVDHCIISEKDRAYRRQGMPLAIEKICGLFE